MHSIYIIFLYHFIQEVYEYITDNVDIVFRYYFSGLLLWLPLA